jgi:hypothetical protein
MRDAGTSVIGKEESGEDAGGSGGGTGDAVVSEGSVGRSQGNEGKVWKMQEDLREVRRDAVVSEGRIEIHGKCKGIPDRHLREMEGRYRGAGGGSEGDEMKWGGNWGRCRGRSGEFADREGDAVGSEGGTGNEGEPRNVQGDTGGSDGGTGRSTGIWGK